MRNRDGEVTDRASGTLSIARPDRFRWDYQKPYLQTIVADGKRLWLYDSDLQQVTVRALEQGLGSTPAMLLSGAGKVGDAFAAAGVETKGDWTWCRLTPKQDGSDFEQVSLAFTRGGELAAMELRDKLEHLVVYAALALWFTGLVQRRRYWTVVLGLAALGLTLEYLQFAMHRGRMGDPWDMAANLLGIAAGVTLAVTRTGGWAPKVEAWLSRN